MDAWRYERSRANLSAISTKRRVASLSMALISTDSAARRVALPPLREAFCAARRAARRAGHLFSGRVAAPRREKDGDPRDQDRGDNGYRREPAVILGRVGLLTIGHT